MQANQKQHEINLYITKHIRHKAKQLIGKVGFTKSDRADIEGELMLDLISRLPKFDASKATLNAFAKTVVARRISRFIRDRKCFKRDYRLKISSLDGRIPGENDGTDSIALWETLPYEKRNHRLGLQSRSPEEEVDLAHDVETVVAALPARLRSICEIVMTGAAGDAMKLIDIPRRTLRDNIAKIRTVFEAAGLQKYL
jgi:RNA polymerase sigma-70 factor (ECF subfamily)